MHRKEGKKYMKLIYGKNAQVKFNTEEELQEAIDYILESDNVQLVHEDNQNQGAWGPEERIQFAQRDDIPDCLLRNMTAGNGSLYGRINCKEFCALINAEKEKKTR